jgi:hypothetical protein
VPYNGDAVRQILQLWLCFGRDTFIAEVSILALSVELFLEIQVVGERHSSQEKKYD